MSSASIQNCVFLEIKVDINSHNKKNDNVVTQYFYNYRDSTLFYVEKVDQYRIKE